MKLTFSEDPALWNGRFAALKMLAVSQVDVGLTSSASGRSRFLMAIHDYMDGGVPPPNSPVTVSGGWVYNRVARKGVPVEGKGFNKPLVDTRQLYNDFDYEITGRLV